MERPPLSTSQPIPQQRIIEKLDEYMSRRDYAGAERHLLYWLEEALTVGDERGQLMLRNELVGHFRKTGNKEQAFLHADEALRLVDALDFSDTISAGTTFTNVGTMFNAFGENERSLELFRKAAALYEGMPLTPSHLLGGLYNNMALTCVSLGRYDEAKELYERALDVMANVENGELEQAITYLNMADAVVAEAGGFEEGFSEDSPECEEEVDRLLDHALELLDTPSVPHDGYYAFVCEKCAPVFAHYGYFLADADLRERAEAIYERA
jgi:tetratricopeptide (TPR) repeat protein